MTTGRYGSPHSHATMASSFNVLVVRVRLPAEGCIHPEINVYDLPMKIISGLLRPDGKTKMIRMDEWHRGDVIAACLGVYDAWDCVKQFDITKHVNVGVYVTDADPEPGTDDPTLVDSDASTINPDEMRASPDLSRVDSDASTINPDEMGASPDLSRVDSDASAIKPEDARMSSGSDHV